ncbi:unnamed protein product [Cyclocybe aegerita]|uniref:F-box domain-containing protein n=1 Tax=Cyclocybe aegerita TaxID=1973307 RepID=A0A8S0XTZ2_CYCAE|nr:unnamed protein product [Cyclocybe aegerita]
MTNGKEDQNLHVCRQLLTGTLRCIVPDDFALPETLDVLGRLERNDIPTDEEIREINEALIAPLTKLNSLEDEVKKLDLLRQELRRRFDVLSDKIRPYRTFISRARRLPADILQEIFFSSLPTEHNSVMSIHHPPLLLMRVCRRWRDITLSTPRLWASIHIPIPSPQFSNPRHAWDVMEYDIPTRRLIEARAEGTRLWLRRSGACALSISLHSWHPGFPVLSVSDPCRFIISAIAEFSSRWRRVEFALPSRHMAEVSAIQDVPLLESLAIDEYLHSSYNVGRYLVPWTESSLLKGPSIRNITFRKSPPNISAIPLAWARIKSIHLALPHPEFDIRKAVTILTFCVQLTHCHIELAWRNANEGASQPHSLLTLTLPLLESLIIHDGGDDITAFFDALSTPSLVELTYKSLLSDFSTRRPSLTTFLSQTPSIRGFTTDPQLFSRVDFEQLLWHCPQITALRTRCQEPGVPAWGPQENNGYHVDDDFLKLFLSPGEDVQCLCPHLDEFHCVFRGGFTDAGMLDFITRKQDGSTPRVAKLKHMSVYFNRPLVMTIGVQTEQFVADGLKLEVRYYRPRVFHGPPSAFDGISLLDEPHLAAERIWEEN